MLTKLWRPHKICHKSVFVERYKHERKMSVFRWLNMCFLHCLSSSTELFTALHLGTYQTSFSTSLISICASYTELNLRWTYHIPAGHNSVHAHHISNDTGFQRWWSLNPVGRLSCVECITHAFMTSITSRHIWLKSGRSFTRWPLIGRSSSGVCAVMHFLKRRTLQTSAVVRLFITDHM